MTHCFPSFDLPFDSADHSLSNNRWSSPLVQVHEPSRGFFIPIMQSSLAQHFLPIQCMSQAVSPAVIDIGDFRILGLDVDMVSLPSILQFSVGIVIVKTDCEVPLHALVVCRRPSNPRCQWLNTVDLIMDMSQSSLDAVGADIRNGSGSLGRRTVCVHRYQSSR